MDDIFLLIKEETDFTTVFGIYNDYIKAEEDYHNVKKYREVYEEDSIHIYKLVINKFYKDTNYEKIL